MLSPRKGCALLISVPVLLIVAIAVEPLITGERQRSTAGVIVPIGGVIVGAPALVGFFLGCFGHWLKSRER